MDSRREPNVVSNVNRAQIRHLQAANGGVGLRVRLLGPMTITNAGSPIGIAQKKSRALLAYLALREGAEVSREVLIGLLWGERVCAKRFPSCVLHSQGRARTRSLQPGRP